MQETAESVAITAAGQMQAAATLAAAVCTAHPERSHVNADFALGIYKYVLRTVSMGKQM